MDMELINKIEARISELEGQSKKLGDFVNGLTANIKKFASEKIKAIDESNAITGAIQAFKSVLGEASEMKKRAAEAESKEENV